MAKTKGVGDGGKEVKTTENASLFQSAELFFLSAGLENQLAELMEGTGDVQTAALRRPREGNSAI